MSPLIEAVEKHVAEDVRYQPLGQIAKIKTGSSVSKRSIENNPGPYPVINSGREPLGYIDSFNTEDDPIGVTSRGAGVGSITWREGRYFRGNLNYGVTVKDATEVNVRFLYHTLLHLQPSIQQLCTYQGIPALNKVKLESLIIPIPQMTVQEEIVEILDTFSCLEMELEAELEMRAQQYEYYENILTEPFDTDRNLKKGWKSVKLGDVSQIVKGKTPIQKAVPGEYPLVATTKERQSSDDFQFDGEAVCVPLISSRGHGVASISRIYYQSGKFALGNILCAIMPHDHSELSAAFLRYFLYSRKDFLLVPLMRGGANVSLTIDSLKAVRVQYPSLPEQQRIVSILDKFETFVNDPSLGLPAEISARRQQLQHYREKLLTFKGSEVST